MAGSQLPSNDSDRIFHCFVSFFLFNLPSLSHLLVVVYWLSHVTLCKPMDCDPPGSSAHGISQDKKIKSQFGKRAHGQRPLRTQGWIGLSEEDEGRKASSLREV